MGRFDSWTLALGAFERPLGVARVGQDHDRARGVVNHRHGRAVLRYVTADLLQRSDHRSVQALEGDIRNWVSAWNENPRPSVWTKTADQILTSLGRLIQRIGDQGHWGVLPQGRGVEP